MTYDRQEEANQLLMLIRTGNSVVRFTTHSADFPFRLAAIKTCCPKESSRPLWHIMTVVPSDPKWCSSLYGLMQELIFIIRYWVKEIIQKRLICHYYRHHILAFPLLTQPKLSNGEFHFRWKEERRDRKQRKSLNGPAMPLVPSAAVQTRL